MLFRFVDLFAGIGGFHEALSSLGHECVFAAEIDDELRELYRDNYPDLPAKQVVSDIRLPENQARIPRHEILCAGFPCQPFSKSGSQRGFLDVTRGTLFHEILKIIDKHRPDLVLLENVGNFARHDGGNTWRIVRESLEALGYDVRGTEPKVAGGHGLISPHHFGHPHHRERFFIVAANWDLPDDPFPSRSQQDGLALDEFLLNEEDFTEAEHRETRITAHQRAVVDLWNEFLAALPSDYPLPSFPIWSDEFGAKYPFEDRTPTATATDELAKALGFTNGGRPDRDELLDLLPSYAVTGKGTFPEWKKRFLRQNREWYRAIHDRVDPGWLEAVRTLPISFRKLEWNYQGGERDLWQHLLQFRPSGLRVKRYSSIPALVAMTTTQIPLLGPRRRFLARREGLRLQGFERDNFRLPQGHGNTFKALGNAVHVEVVRRIVESVLSSLDYPK